MLQKCKAATIALSLIGLLGLTACIPTQKFDSNYDQLEARAGKLNTILVLQPEVIVNELSAGNVKEKMPDWSKQGKENVLIALRHEAKGATRKVKVVDPKSKFNKEIKQITELNVAVISSAYDHAAPNGYGQYDMNTFPQRIADFDYSIGSVKNLLNAYRADGLLIVRGEDNISTSGRKTLGVVQAINPFSDGQQSGVTFLQATLTDINGDVLWWNYYAEAGGYDLRDPEGAAKFVKKTLEGFPPQRGK